MINKSELISSSEFEASYRSVSTRNNIIVLERVISTTFIKNIKYYYIECYNNIEKNESFDVKFIVALDGSLNITALSLETYKSGKLYRYAEFKFKQEEVLFDCYEYHGKRRVLKENKIIGMSDLYIPFIEPVSYRHLITKEFPSRGIRRCDGFFITTIDGDISYKITNCELYFDGEEEVEINLGTFSCTKRRILYNLYNKLIMETFYNDKENVCVSLSKILEGLSDVNDTTQYEIVERTERISKLPEIFLFNNNSDNQFNLYKTLTGKHNYYDTNNELIGIEEWVRKEINKFDEYRFHTLYNTNNEPIIDIKLKHGSLYLDRYAEFKINDIFKPIIMAKGEARYWFFNNKVLSQYISKSTEYKMASYSAEGYYVFYPLAGLTDLVIINREYPIHSLVKSYSVKFHNLCNSNRDILKPDVSIQQICNISEEYIEIIGKKFYSMKLEIKDYDSLSMFWLDKDNLITLKWSLFDKTGKNLILQAKLSELKIYD